MQLGKQEATVFNYSHLILFVKTNITQKVMNIVNSQIIGAGIGHAPSYLKS